MRKIIFIGESNYNIVLDASGAPVGSMTGGIIARAAVTLGTMGSNVVMASEVATDALGDLVVADFMKAGVDIKSVDRYSEGRTALNIYMRDTVGVTSSVVRYEAYPDEAFDIVWPRVEPDDIVVFGGYYAIDPRMRKRLQQLLNHASERHALLIYLPGFAADRQPRMTRIMPQIFENLEVADMLIARNRDLELLFGVKPVDECYHDHIDFYCRSLVNLDETCARINYYSGREMSTVSVEPQFCGSMVWQAGAVAGIVAAVGERCLKPEALCEPDRELREAIINSAARSGAVQAKSIVKDWQKI